MKTFSLLFLTMAITLSVSATVFTVTVQNFSFSPQIVTATCGDTIKWVWVNGTHTTTSSLPAAGDTVPAGAATWDANIQNSGQSLTYPLVVGGHYRYHCKVHGFAVMNGTINVSCSAILNLTFFHQGYYMGSSKMQQVLFNEGVESNPASTNVDTFKISLGDSATSTFVQTVKGVLKTNGTLSLTFPGSVIGHKYYIYIFHRNSIETSSANTVAMNSTTIYHFDTGAGQAFGGNEVQVQTGVWAIYTGDYNQDGFIDPFDFTPYDNDNSHQVSGVYVNTDLNGDGFVDPFDFPTYDGNNSQQITANVPF